MRGDAGELEGIPASRVGNLAMSICSVEKRHCAGPNVSLGSRMIIAGKLHTLHWNCRIIYLGLSLRPRD